MPLPHARENITYAHYLQLDDDIRFEVINGQIYNMSPSPTPRHQDVVTQLGAEFAIYLRGKQCKVFVSPIDVCLSDEKENLSKVKEWVAPDLVVLCDKNKIGNKRIIGSPDLIVEVLSPSTAKNDRIVKYNRYQKVGIKEYWIVDPVNEFVDVYLLTNESYKHRGTFFKGDRLPVGIFGNFIIDLNNIFTYEE